MKKTYDRKVFKRKLPGRRIRVIIILLQTVVLVGFPLMMQANTQDSTRQKSYAIKGKVVDEKNEPLPGVTVRLDSTFLGCTTDKKGHFSFLLPRKTGKLIFSFVGFKTVKMDFNADKFFVREDERRCFNVRRGDDCCLRDAEQEGGDWGHVDRKGRGDKGYSYPFVSQSFTGESARDERDQRYRGSRWGRYIGDDTRV